MNTNKKSFLVHRKGTWIIGGQSEIDFLSNLIMFYPANKYFGANVGIFVACYADTNKKSLLGHQKGTLILWGQPKTDFLSNLTILYPDNPHVGARVSVVVVVLTKGTAVCGVDYTDTNKSHHWSIRKVHEFCGEIKDRFLVQTHHIPPNPANPCFGAKLSIFVGVSTKNTTVYSCRLYRYQLKVIIRSSRRHMNPERAIRVRFLLFCPE